MPGYKYMYAYILLYIYIIVVVDIYYCVFKTIVVICHSSDTCLLHSHLYPLIVVIIMSV